MKNDIHRENKVPTEAEWGSYSDDLDEKYAHDHFFGRTNDEMLEEYRNNITTRTADLRFMPAAPFRYYIFGFRDFIVGRQFNELDAPDAANCFITLIEDKLKDNPDHIIPIINELLGALEYVANNQDEYGADIEIYGDFKIKLDLIKSYIVSDNRTTS